MIDLNHITVDLSNLPPTTGPKPSRQMIASVKQYGVIVPIIVTLDGSGKYLTLDGNRRVAAMRANGITSAHMPAIVVTTQDPELVTILINELRSPNYATESAAIDALRLRGYDTKAIAAHTGMPGVSIDKRLRYLVADPSLAEAFDNGHISATVMDSISRSTPEEQAALATIYSGKGTLSAFDVRGVREALRAPLPADTATPDAPYPDATEITYAELRRAISDLAERASNSGFRCDQLIDLVTTAPAFAPSLKDVTW